MTGTTDRDVSSFAGSVVLALILVAGKALLLPVCMHGVATHVQ